MTFRTRIFCLLLLFHATSAAAQTDLMTLPSFPDFWAVGVGAGPEYIGSSDSVMAAAPAGQMNFGKRYISLQANYFNANVVDDAHWSAGPAGVLRLGRHDVKDDQVDKLPDIPMSLSLGGFVGYSFAGGPDPRDRWRIGATALQDVGGNDQGFVADINLRRWLPVGRYGAAGLGLASSWASDDYMDTFFSVDDAGSLASGLPTYHAGSGWRDVRIQAMIVHPISTKWAVGTGLMYSYLLNEAADSPVVKSRDQFYFGIGLARFW